MGRLHEDWISVVSCRCGDGRDLRVRVTVVFRRPCTADEAHPRARTIAELLSRELEMAARPEALLGREREFAGRLARRASSDLDVAQVALTFSLAGEAGSLRPSQSTNAMPAVMAMASAAGSLAPATAGGSGAMRFDSSEPGPLSQRPDAAAAGRGKHELRPRVLVAHSDARVLLSVNDVLAEEFEVRTAVEAQQAIGMAMTADFDLVLAQEELGDGAGLAVLEAARARAAGTTGVLLTTRERHAAAGKKMRAASITPRTLTVPFEPADLLARARSVVTLVRMRSAAARLSNPGADS